MLFRVGVVLWITVFAQGLAYNADIKTFSYAQPPMKHVGTGADFFGQKFRLTTNESSVLIGAPNYTIAGDLGSASGGIFNCSLVDLNTIICSPLKKIPNALAVGSSFYNSLTTSTVACSFTQPLKCLTGNYFPGYCYSSTSFETPWESIKYNAHVCPPHQFHADVVFVLDGSGSIGKTNFEFVKKWVISITKILDIEAGKVRVGVIQYSHYYDGHPDSSQIYIKTEIALGSLTTQQGLEDKINAISLQGYTTHTGEGLKKAKIEFEKYGKKNASKVVILLTDGKSDDDVKTPSKALRDDGVKIFAVGVGKAVDTELREIANGGLSGDLRVYNIKDFSKLAEVASSITSTLRVSVLEGGTSNNSQVSFDMNNGQAGIEIYAGMGNTFGYLVRYVKSLCMFDWGW